MKPATYFVVALALLAASAAQAADLKSAKSAASVAVEAADLPGGDIFGFTSGTDVGKVGDRGIALESSAAHGLAITRLNVIPVQSVTKNNCVSMKLLGKYTSLKCSNSMDVDLAAGCGCADSRFMMTAFMLAASG